MSSGCECAIIEVEPGKWYYVLEDGSAPKNAWDWREFASAYGSFKSEEEAIKHLDEHHANPGGWSVTRHNEYRPSEIMTKLMAEAPENMKRIGGISPFRGW